MPPLPNPSTDPLVAVPTKPPLPAAFARNIEEQQRRVRAGEVRLTDVPGYVPGQPPSVDTWHDIDYLDIYPKIWGREFGANGIGKLREVALTVITPAEKFDLFDEDPAYFPKTALAYDELDISRMQDQSAQYQEAMEAAGVMVHRIEFPSPPVGAYGPQRSTWATNELFIVRGGSVTEKLALSPFGYGRTEYLSLWAMTYLGIPPVLAIMGKGVLEAGPSFWLAEDVFVTGRGIAYNQEGLDQFLPVVRMSSGLDEKDWTALTIDFPGPKYFDADTGVSHHPDMVLGALDVGKVIAYPSGLDFKTWEYLRKNGYEIVEIERDEQIRYAPANVMLLEPGVVIMHAEAVNAIAAVRKAGVEVIPVPYSEFLRAGGGLHCSTMRIWRETGPFSTDR
jgi:N-dimethylarginine dimethylaminohydrolase